MKKVLIFIALILLPLSISAEGHAKYVFLFIGDGMALPQINAAEAYLNAVGGNEPGIEKLNFTRFPAQGLTTTYSLNSFITDSAAAGTAIACGEKTLSGVIAMTADRKRNLTSIAESAKSAGMKVGIITTVSLDNATPAVFYAHSSNRGNYHEINTAMAQSSFDYFAGGRLCIERTPSGKKNAHEIMEERGFVIASTRPEFEALQPINKQIYAYSSGFAGNANNFAIDQTGQDISLAEFTRKGIEVLDNENGFFMMIEGGKIDWACHANDAAAMIHETLAFDDAVAEAITFYNEHPEETLIVVTADHETGGLSLGFAGTKYGSDFKLLSGQKMSYEAFNKFILNPYKESHPLSGSLSDLMPGIEENFGLYGLSELEETLLSDAFKMSVEGRTSEYNRELSYLLYGKEDPLTVTITHLLNRRAGISWSTYSHTGLPVQTFAVGTGEEMFNGYYDNTDIYKKLFSLMALESSKETH